MRSIYKGLEQFREHLGGDLTLAMPMGIGKRDDIHAINLELCEQAIRRLKRRHLKKEALSEGVVSGKSPVISRFIA